MCESTKPVSVVESLRPYDDRELDAAMRELEVLEAAERDLKVLRSVWQRRLLGMLAGVACMLGVSVASADAPAKPKRPTMCLHGKAISGEGFVGYVCLDGKRPRIFTRYVEVKFVDEAGKPKSYVLGWSAPVEKRGTGYVAEGTPRKPATIKL